MPNICKDQSFFKNHGVAIEEISKGIYIWKDNKNLSKEMS